MGEQHGSQGPDESDDILRKFFWIVAAGVAAYALTVIIYVL